VKCSKCKKPLKRGYFYNGLPFGPECIKMVAGRSVKLKKLKAFRLEKDQESESESQMGLFDDNTN